MLRTIELASVPVYAAARESIPPVSDDAIEKHREEKEDALHQRDVSIVSISALLRMRALAASMHCSVEYRKGLLRA